MDKLVPNDIYMNVYLELKSNHKSTKYLEVKHLRDSLIYTDRANHNSKKIMNYRYIKRNKKTLQNISLAVIKDLSMAMKNVLKINKSRRPRVIKTLTGAMHGTLRQLNTINRI